MIAGHSEKDVSTAHVSPLDDLAALGILDDRSEPRRRRTKKTTTLFKQVTHPDTVHQRTVYESQVEGRAHEDAANTQQFTGRKRKLESAVSPRKSQRIKKSHIVISSKQKGSIESSTSLDVTSHPSQKPPAIQSPSSQEETFTQSDAVLSGSEPIEVVRDSNYNSGIADKSHAKPREESFNDPTNEHHEFDSILESEGFSMISVSTLPSGKIGLNLADHGRRGNEEDSDLNRSLEEGNTKPALSPQWHQDLGAEAENHVELPSQDEDVPPDSSTDSVERLIEYQTPSPMSLNTSNLPKGRPLFNPNPTRALDEVTDRTPKILRVVRAGTALHDVIRPLERQEKFGLNDNEEFEPTHSGETVPNIDDKKPFDRFGAGTQRELRAGLRLGEELAKRWPANTSEASHGDSSPDGDAFRPVKDLNNLGSTGPQENLETGAATSGPRQDVSYPVVSYPQLPSPEGSEIDQMSWQTNTPLQSEENSRKTPNSRGQETIEGTSYNHDRTMAREAEWQQERDAVVRQIEMANASRVIIIGDETEFQDKQQQIKSEETEDSDIWRAGAQSSAIQSSSPDQQPLNTAQTQNVRPRRGLIPSPWRRQDQANPTVAGVVDSDLFWRPGWTASAEGTSNEQQDARRGSAESKDSRSIFARRSHPPSSSSTYVSSTSRRDELIDHDLRKGGGAISISSTVVESIEADESTTRQPIKTVRSSRVVSSKSSNHFKNATKISKSKGNPRVALTIKTTTRSKSWLSYITSFLPKWIRQPFPLQSSHPRRLPNGNLRLPHASSSGPLCRYKPWTLDHWNALYVHYAAAREGRVPLTFNPSSRTACHVGVYHRFRKWRKPITREDCAIADAFLADLKIRSRGRDAAGAAGGKGKCGTCGAECGHDGNGNGDGDGGGDPIDEHQVLGKLFYLWKAGVMHGECEVGAGTTGWVNGTEEWWRPQMESWYHRKGK